jgi:hypothetical protein
VWHQFKNVKKYIYTEHHLKNRITVCNLDHKPSALNHISKIGNIIF